MCREIIFTVVYFIFLFICLYFIYCIYFLFPLELGLGLEFAIFENSGQIIPKILILINSGESNFLFYLFIYFFCFIFVLFLFIVAYLLCTKRVVVSEYLSNTVRAIEVVVCS